MIAEYYCPTCDKDIGAAHVLQWSHPVNDAAKQLRWHLRESKICGPRPLLDQRPDR